ncbi:ABC transporter permease [Yinghuangia seranimata]|uniref:ABC transporter permease n=1 Tax=Yinghuangia seranimata TaxID=408067 RepID=UPI00248D04EE|nr:ABC transporter permease [Yinghuangia seranimata]MDI2126577.1 ABC transporter permease [Yinghuangia seranimata]
MTVFVVRRLALLVLALFLASLLAFALLRLLPGDAAAARGGITADPAQLRAIRHELGLDRSLAEQYRSWLGGVLHGDLGRSQLNGTSVTAELGEKLRVTGPLVLAALALALAGAVPLGVLAALRHRTRLGTGISTVGQLGIALPTLWVGLLLVTVFAVEARLLPAQGFPVEGWSAPGEAARSLVLPVVTLALSEGAVLLRFVRSAALDVLGRDFLRTARASGRTRAGALWRHGLRNAAGPVLSVLGVQVAALLVGAVVVEKVFALPGVGSMLVADVGNRDMVKVQGEVLVVVAVVLAVGFLVDVAQRLIDPRLRETAS